MGVIGARPAIDIGKWCNSCWFGALKIVNYKLQSPTKCTKCAQALKTNMYNRVDEGTSPSTF